MKSPTPSARAGDPTMTRPVVRRRQIARSDMPTQFVWYLLVGGLSFLTDLAAFIALLNVDVPVA